MRKWIAIMIMILVSLNFIISTRNKQSVVKSQKEVSHLLDEMQIKIDKQYPTDPLDIVILHNDLMHILYGKKITDEQMELVVKLQRKLYAEELLTLNPEENQLESVANEISTNEEKGIKLIGSKILKSYYEQSGNITATVVHYTNQKDISRHYILKKDLNEENKWKIYRWNNEGSYVIQEE